MAGGLLIGPFVISVRLLRYNAQGFVLLSGLQLCRNFAPILNQNPLPSDYMVSKILIEMSYYVFVITFDSLIRTF